MKHNSVRTAFDHVDVEPSPTFRDNLRAQFVAEMTQSDHVQSQSSEARHDDAANNGENGVTVTVIDAPQAEANAKNRRPNMIVGVAAAIIVVAVLTAVVLTRRSEPSGVDSSHDPAIADSALMTTEQLGNGWRPLNPQGSANPLLADIAASVPACTPYVDYAFDGPQQKSVTTERDFQGDVVRPLTQLVYIFPTEAEATEAMSKIAEPAFVPCFNAFIDALIPPTSGGQKVDTTTASDVPPFATHGDQQVALPQSIAFRGGDTFTVISFFVQVGRGIVYVDPLLRRSDPTDSKGYVEKTVAAAADALAAALR